MSTVLRYYFTLLVRKVAMPDLILMKELIEEFWPLLWKYVMRVCKGKLQAAHDLCQVTPIRRKAPTRADLGHKRARGGGVSADYEGTGTIRTQKDDTLKHH